MISITVVQCGPEEEALVLQVLRSGMLAGGPMVERFEAACREMTGTAHAIAVNNGTTALAVALEVLDLDEADEVVTSPFTFVATINAIIQAGARVRFADINATDFAMSPAALEAVVGDHTRVVMPVHLYGQAADMAPLAATAARLGATIIEDAAQAHGATYHGAPVGGFGMATFSFYATKNLQCGEGGVVTTNDDQFADRLRLLRNHGMRARYQYEMPGHNYRMTDLNAAVAIPQFDRLADIITSRTANAQFYNSCFSGLAGVVTPSTAVGRGHAWHQYTLRITDEATRSRDDLVEQLQAHGIGAGVYYPRRVFDYDCFRNHPLVDIGDGCPVAAQVANQVVSLPVHQHLSSEQLQQVADTVASLLR